VCDIFLFKKRKKQQPTNKMDAPQCLFDALPNHLIVDILDLLAQINYSTFVRFSTLSSRFWELSHSPLIWAHINVGYQGVALHPAVAHYYRSRLAQCRKYSTCSDWLSEQVPVVVALRMMPNLRKLTISKMFLEGAVLTAITNLNALESFTVDTSCCGNTIDVTTQDLVKHCSNAIFTSQARIKRLTIPNTLIQPLLFNPENHFEELHELVVELDDDSIDNNLHTLTKMTFPKLKKFHGCQHVLDITAIAPNLEEWIDETAFADWRHPLVRDPGCITKPLITKYHYTTSMWAKTPAIILQALPNVVVLDLYDASGSYCDLHTIATLTHLETLRIPFFCSKFGSSEPSQIQAVQELCHITTLKHLHFQCVEWPTKHYCKSRAVFQTILDSVCCSKLTSLQIPINLTNRDKTRLRLRCGASLQQLAVEVLESDLTNYNISVFHHIGDTLSECPQLTSFHYVCNFPVLYVGQYLLHNSHKWPSLQRVELFGDDNLAKELEPLALSNKTIQKLRVGCWISEYNSLVCIGKFRRRERWDFGNCYAFMNRHQSVVDAHKPIPPPFDDGMHLFQ
jgi:hypothetical protein